MALGLRQSKHRASTRYDDNLGTFDDVGIGCGMFSVAELGSTAQLVHRVLGTLPTAIRELVRVREGGDTVTNAEHQTLSSAARSGRGLRRHP